MDWQNKFYSIVKETDTNLAKAKEKLTGKSSSTFDKFPVGAATAGNPYTNSFQQNLIPIPLPDTSNLIMNSDYNVQLLHLQEQINSQSRTLEKLQKLVISLNSERNFHKEQISRLKDDMDKLTDKTSSQFVAANFERQVSAMKRELMHEIEKVKAIVKNYAEETSNTKRSSLSSSSWNEDFWTMKENLTENLEQVQREINAMCKRLDKLESPVCDEKHDVPRPTSLSKNAHYTDRFQRPPHLYTPLYKSSEEISSFDLQQLRHNVSSLNTKLDRLEKKIDATHCQQPLVTTHQWSGHIRYPHNHTSCKSSLLDIDKDDLHSLSEFSDISSLSGNNTDDSIDALTSELQDLTILKPRTRNKIPAYKTGKAKKVNVDFDISDSDIDEVDLETDSLDLDN